MIDELSNVETDKVNHIVETDIMKLVVEIECFGEFDKETGSSDGLQPKQADLNCVHALNEPHLLESCYLSQMFMSHLRKELSEREWKEGCILKRENDMHLLDSEDTSADHLPKIKTRPDWLKPIPKEEMLETPEPD
ncbi:hypothetical protein Tco_1371565 [Tanacetum coccineum]